MIEHDIMQYETMQNDMTYMRPITTSSTAKGGGASFKIGQRRG